MALLITALPPLPLVKNPSTPMCSLNWKQLITSTSSGCNCHYFFGWSYTGIRGYLALQDMEDYLRHFLIRPLPGPKNSPK